MPRIVPNTTHRDRLGGVIANAIEDLRESRLETAARLGVNEADVPLLVAGGRGRYTVDRLLDFCEPLGLVPGMTIIGLNPEPAPPPRMSGKVRPLDTPSETGNASRNLSLT
ncbi:hypothetical protein [Nocardia sp. NPDC023988]|uniref:hypothetical protein n=1 Tax=unclassified Nocardia TaxID=2637762 RepID=UPI0033E1883A